MEVNKKENKYLSPCAVCKHQDECNINNNKQFGQGCADLVIHSKFYYL